MYRQYIYGSAEVIGLMCLRVFTEGNTESYNHLKAPARSLGSAFQKINFLRDMKSDFDEQYRVWRGAVIYGIKKRADKEVAFGLTYNNSFRRTIVLPFWVWNQTFNDKWGIETVLPLKITVRRNFKHNDMLLFGTDYWSSGYSMDIQSDAQAAAEQYLFKSSALHLFVDYQKRLISDWTWISLKAGWAYNFDFPKKSQLINLYYPILFKKQSSVYIWKIFNLIKI